jgi:hypothetical protein
MRHKTKTIIGSKWLKLLSSANTTTGRKHYIVKMVGSPRASVGTSIVAEMRTLFDPGKNRGSANGYSWKFRSRDEAEKLVTMALLTWGE